MEAGRHEQPPSSRGLARSARNSLETPYALPPGEGELYDTGKGAARESWARLVPKDTPGGFLAGEPPSGLAAASGTLAAPLPAADRPDWGPAPEPQEAAEAASDEASYVNVAVGDVEVGWATTGRDDATDATDTPGPCVPGGDATAPGATADSSREGAPPRRKTASQRPSRLRLRQAGGEGGAGAGASGAVEPAHGLAPVASEAAPELPRLPAAPVKAVPKVLGSVTAREAAVPETSAASGEPEPEPEARSEGSGPPAGADGPRSSHDAPAPLATECADKILSVEEGLPVRPRGGEASSPARPAGEASSPARPAAGEASSSARPTGEAPPSAWRAEGAPPQSPELVPSAVREMATRLLETPEAKRRRRKRAELQRTSGERQPAWASGEADGPRAGREARPAGAEPPRGGEDEAPAPPREAAAGAARPLSASILAVRQPASLRPVPEHLRGLAESLFALDAVEGVEGVEGEGGSVGAAPPPPRAPAARPAARVAAAPTETVVLDLSREPGLEEVSLVDDDDDSPTVVSSSLRPIAWVPARAPPPRPARAAAAGGVGAAGARSGARPADPFVLPAPRAMWTHRPERRAPVRLAPPWEAASDAGRAAAAAAVARPDVAFGPYAGLPAPPRPLKRPLTAEVQVVSAPGQRGRAAPPSPRSPPARSAPKCGICLEPMDGEARKMASGPCGHVYCADCLREAIKTSKRCPTCRKPLKPKQLHYVYLSF